MHSAKLLDFFHLLHPVPASFLIPGSAPFRLVGLRTISSEGALMEVRGGIGQETWDRSQDNPEFPEVDGLV